MLFVALRCWVEASVVRRGVVDGFFHPVGASVRVPSDRCTGASMYVIVTSTLTHGAGRDLCVVSCRHGGFLCMSSGPLFLYNRSPRRIRRGNCTFCFRIIPSSRVGHLVRVGRTKFQFCCSRPVRGELSLSVRCGFRVRASRGRPRLVRRGLAPILLDNGKSV